MKRLLFLCLISSAVWAQNPNTAVYPGANASDSTLFVATNNAQTTLNGTINNAVTSIVLTSGTTFIAPVIITIDSEIIHCTTLTTNTLSGCSRGQQGTAAATHTTGVTVYGFLTAYQMNQALAEIKALEANAAKATQANTFTGIQTMTAPVFTTPKVTTILDANGNPFIASSATASAVDSITITNAATANPATVSIAPSGSDANINLSLSGKGTGSVQFPNGVSSGSSPPPASVCTPGTAGMNCAGEGTTPTGTLAAVGVMWPNSATHRWDMINGAVNVQIVGTGGDINTSDQVTITHLAAPLPVGQGGTGITVGTAGKVLGGATPSMVTITSAYVDTSIALTGIDINTSNQVTVTHLASALPVNQGGTGLTGGTAAKVLGGATPSMVTITSAYVDNSIALTGTDINTSNQVTVTHLAAALPVNQGGSSLLTRTLHALYVGNGTSAETALAVGATDKPLVGVTAGDPVFSKITLTNPTTAATITFAADNETVTLPNGTLVPNTVTVNGHALSANVTVTTTDLGLNNVTNDAQTKASIVPNTAPAAGQILAGNAGGTAYAPVTISGDETLASTGAVTIAALAVTSAKMAVVNTRRVCDIAVGDTSGSALTNAQLGPQVGVCFIPYAATVVEIDVRADAGTPNIIIGQELAGTVLNLTSAALATGAAGIRACSKTTAVAGIDGTTCSATLQNTALAAGTYIQPVSGTAGGTAKWMTAHVVYTVN